MKTLKTSRMVKQITTAFSLVLSLAATIPALAQKKGHSSGTASAKPAMKFLDAIEVRAVDMAPDQAVQAVATEPVPAESQSDLKEETTASSSALVENASAIQLKYAVLLNTEVEAVQNTALFSTIDEWYGTRYELGGSTKDGIDCSAFVQVVYSKLFQISMPRTAKEQYSAVNRVSRNELKQGDLVFFHTRGSGVSHVGIYLQNNKFVHAATSGGVMISDLDDEYWSKHYVSSGRYETTCEPQQLLTANP